MKGSKGNKGQYPKGYGQKGGKGYQFSGWNQQYQPNWGKGAWGSKGKGMDGKGYKGVGKGKSMYGLEEPTQPWTDSEQPTRDQSNWDPAGGNWYTASVINPCGYECPPGLSGARQEMMSIEEADEQPWIPIKKKLSMNKEKKEARKAFIT